MWISGGSPGVWLSSSLHALRRPAELADEVLPLADAQVVEELGVAALAELVRRELELALADVPPEVEQREEVGELVGEPGVELVGLRLLLGRALARVLDRERRRDHDHLLRAVLPLGLEDHPAQAGIDRELREPAPELGELLLLVERGELLQQPHAVADLAAVGRVEEREVLDVAEAGGGHGEDHGGEARAQDLRVGELRALLEVLLVVEADADAVGDAAAATLALVRPRPG